MIPPLQKYEESAPFKNKWSYRSLVCMLTYLARNTRQDLKYAVYQCARFQCNSRELHVNAIKRIGGYLIGTKDKGISFKLTKDVSHFECYVDASFLEITQVKLLKIQTRSNLEQDV